MINKIDDEEIYICDFCGKSNLEVFLMVNKENTDTDICNECVSACVDIMINPNKKKELQDG